MASKQEIPVLVSAENLCAHTMKICNNINNFPKKWRYTLVDRTINATLDIRQYINEANHESGEERVYCIDKSIRSCEDLKFYIKLCHEVLHPQCSIPYWDEMVENIEKQLHNWKSYTRKQLKT